MVVFAKQVNKSNETMSKMDLYFEILKNKKTQVTH